jgi:hypothetical protein
MADAVGTEEVKMKQTFLSYLLVSLLLASVCGAEFQVNTRTSNDQKNGAIAMDAAGSFMVVWSSYGQDGSSNGIFAQRFDPNCSPAGGEFQINATSSGNQAEPAVAMDAAAGFVVAWQGPGSIEDANEDVFAQRFDPNGLPVGDELRVNSITGDKQLYPSVAVSDDGTFVVVWESANAPEEGKKAICGQLYDDSGARFGAEFVINAESSICRYPVVAADANGNFAVVWMRDKSRNSIMARLYNADGSARTDSFEVSTVGFGSVTRPSIAMDAAGHFVVAWDGDPNLASLDDIHARLYEPNGTPLGGQFVVNTSLTGAQQYPQVATNDRQEFVIVWDSKVDPNVNERDIFGQRFDSLGGPIGGEFQVNTYVLDDQRYPAVAIREDGRFVAVWQSDNQDGSQFGIFGEIGPQVGSADFNGDGLVDFGDYCILIEEWGEEQNALTADLTDDNRIDEQDLAEFCRQWLTPGDP